MFYHGPDFFLTELFGLPNASTMLITTNDKASDMKTKKRNMAFSCPGVSGIGTSGAGRFASENRSLGDCAPSVSILFVVKWTMDEGIAVNHHRCGTIFAAPLTT